MTTLTFEIAGVKSSSKNSARRNGSMQPLNSFLSRQITRRYSSQRRGQNRSGNEPDGGIFWPSSKHIDPARLTPQILLVKDHGVYLITNASLDGACFP